MNNVEALKTLYTALGGETSTVAGASTVVDVLNEISKLFSGDDDATLNAEAIANIAAVASVLVPKPSQDKTITPTTSDQSVTADTGKVLGTVTVKGVTAAIDDNIVAGNIKDGVTILGVTGTYDGT